MNLSLKKKLHSKNNKIIPCIIGLGYVGLPIFMNLSKKFETLGFDINKNRVAELKKSFDRNLEFKSKDLKKINKKFFSLKKNQINKANFFIVTVPTPVKKSNKPDLSHVKNSMKNLAKIVKKDDIIILESTVYPGVTEEVCKKILNTNVKSLRTGYDFFLGYSPERINPGDNFHKLKNINKIVALESKKKINVVKRIYKELGKKIIFSSKIKEAETAKVVENIQRDINIAFINELFIFCKKSKIDFKEVLNLAKTKWNFMSFKPGLVGGHCLPVDPYYFAEVAKKSGQNVKVTLAGRSINNGMVPFVTKMILDDIKKIKKNKPKILISGLTYKPNVPDTRNSLAIKIFNNIKKKYFTKGFDPIVSKKDRKNMKLINRVNISEFDKIYVLTEHSVFKNKEYLNNDKISFLFRDF